MVKVSKLKKTKKARTGDDNERGTRGNLHRPSPRQVSKVKVEVDCRHCNLMTPMWRGFCIHCLKPLSEETRRALSR